MKKRREEEEARRAAEKVELAKLQVLMAKDEQLREAVKLLQLKR
ncbi:MAG: hypothetical protein ACRC1K_13780 [Planctomycetia bacterium]